MSWATKQQQKQVKLGIWLNLLPPGMLGHLKRWRKIFVFPFVFVKDRFIKSYERWAQMSSIPWETHLWGKEVFMRFCKNLLCFHFKPWHHFLLFNFQKSSFAQFWVGRSPMSGKLCFPSIFILVCDNEQWYCPNYRLIDIRVLDVRGLDVRGWTLGVWTFGVEPRTSVFRRSGFGVRGSYQYPKMVKKTPNVRTPNVQTPNVRTPNVRKHHRSKNWTLNIWTPNVRKPRMSENEPRMSKPRMSKKPRTSENEPRMSKPRTSENPERPKMNPECLNPERPKTPNVLNEPQTSSCIRKNTKFNHGE